MNNAKIIIGDKKLELELIKSSMGKSALNVSSVGEELGVFLYDSGFLSTAPCSSKITFVDGKNGILSYRGHIVSDIISQKRNFLSVANLLINGEFLDKEGSDSFLSDVDEFPFDEIASLISSFSTKSHPMAILGACFTYFASLYPEHSALRNFESGLSLGKNAIAYIPYVVAMIYRYISSLPFVKPRKDLGYIRNLLFLLFEKDDFKDSIVEAIDTFLILHADHEQNASTLALRTSCSTGVNIFASMVSAVMTLWGPAHGGANEAVIKMLQSIGDISQVESFVSKVKSGAGNVRLMGFGHRVYKNYDPRAKIMKPVCYKAIDQINNDNFLLKIATRLEDVALVDEYFVKRKLYPNVDFYSGLLLQSIGIPSNMFTLFFALARVSGWVAQWCEMVSDESAQKIWRPRQVYIGK